MPAFIRSFTWKHKSELMTFELTNETERIVY